MVGSGVRVGCGVMPVGVLIVRSRMLGFSGERGGLSNFSGDGVLRLRSRVAIPGIAMPPRPKTGWGASGRAR